VWYTEAGSNPADQTKQQTKKNMFDSENPEGYNTQAESCPEFDAVRSTDDGFSCGGGEDDSLLEWMKKNGF
jgi:hypothetical protein